jgi:hypothetical protein
VREKVGGLTEAANRVAGLLDADGGHAGRRTTIRLPAVARAVATWSRHHTAGRLLFPRPHLRGDDSPGPPGTKNPDGRGDRTAHDDNDGGDAEERVVERSGW